MTMPFIIAEIAGCHEGRWELAERLIKAAANAGASAVKTQYCSDPDLMAMRRHMTSGASYARLAFPRAWHARFAKACHAHDLHYLTSVFLRDDLPLVTPFVDRLKVASLEVGDEVLVRACLATGKPVILSSGCLTADEWRALRIRYRKYASRGQIAWLHAVSAYPTGIGESNLRCLAAGAAHGYSDHTGRLITGALAVALGARILEVHLRLDDTNPANPDYGHSLTPDQLRDYIMLANIAFQERGDGVKRIQESERSLMTHRVLS